MKPSVVTTQLVSLDALKACADELLHVGMHRWCMGIASPAAEQLSIDVPKAKLGGTVFQPSTYVAKFVEGLKRPLDSLDPARSFPSASLSKLFILRYVFCAQSLLLHEFAKLARKKLADVIVTQLSVDSQGMHQQLSNIFEAEGGKRVVVLPDYVGGVIKAVLVLDTLEKRVEWIRMNHEFYAAQDIVLLLSAGDKAVRQQLERFISEISHVDVVPVQPFVLRLNDTLRHA
jgi:hypothetical protein